MTYCKKKDRIDKIIKTCSHNNNSTNMFKTCLVII